MSNIEYTIGNVIRNLREEQDITLSKLCNGICSISTMNRIETGERDMDMMLAIRIFQRLGYNPNKFELYDENEDFQQYDQRIALERNLESNDYEALAEGLYRYQTQWEKWISVNPLQQQFIKKIQGTLEISNENIKEGIDLLEDAILISIPDYKENWFKKVIVGEEELELINYLADANESLGQKEKAFKERMEIINYIEYKQIRKEQITKLYSGVVCKAAPVLLEKDRVRTCLEICEDALETLASRMRLYHLADILYWKGKTLECLHLRGTLTKQEVIDTLQKAYYMYVMFGNETMAGRVKEHLRRMYRWECI